MIKIILTGSIATGKSFVSNIMQELGAIIIDTDIIAHNIYNYPSLTAKKIIKEFGNGFLENNKINRNKLANLVFHDKKALQKLNSIVHPDVRQEVYNLTKKYQEIEDQRETNLLLVYVIPLYFETGKNYEADYVVVAACSKENQIERLIIRNSFSYDEAIARINSQIPIDEKVSEADYIIDTNNNFDTVENDVKNLILSWDWQEYQED